MYIRIYVYNAPLIRKFETRNSSLKALCRRQSWSRSPCTPATDHRAAAAAADPRAAAASRFRIAQNSRFGLLRTAAVASRFGSSGIQPAIWATPNCSKFQVRVAPNRGGGF